jgi:hypothetical protein
MDIKTILNEIENNDLFLSWKEDNRDVYLVHIFKMLDQQNKEEIQIGYYNPSNALITTFIFNEKTKEISKNPESEAYREKETHIDKLNLNDIKINFAVIMQKIEKLRNEKYNQHPVEKSFFILQTIDNKPLWNFTIISKTLNIVNIKISAENGIIIDDKLTSIFDFKVK